MRVYALLAIAIPTVIAIACGGEAPAPVTPDGVGSAPPSGSTTTAPVAALTAWQDDAPVMDQVAFMKTSILPHMSKTFQDHDGKKYANFSCGTCHGPNKENPHKFLPKLKLSGDGFTKLMAEKPEMTKWMHEAVEPEMAKAMGETPYDMKTNTGFGCKGCHAVE